MEDIPQLVFCFHCYIIFPHFPSHHQWHYSETADYLNKIFDSLLEYINIIMHNARVGWTLKRIGGICALSIPPHLDYATVHQ